MTKDEFIGQVFEIAFGDSAIEKDFSFDEVLEVLKQFSEDALRYTNPELFN